MTTTQMNILESLVTGKRSAETCEDGIAATADHVAVIDGSTSKAAQPLTAAMSNGRLAGIVERGKDFGDIPGEQETIMALAAKYV